VIALHQDWERRHAMRSKEAAAIVALEPPG
jgi:hypothetical protein